MGDVKFKVPETMDTVKSFYLSNLNIARSAPTRFTHPLHPARPSACVSSPARATSAEVFYVAFTAE